MTFTEIFVIDFFELHFYSLPSCVNKINEACHLTINDSNWFVSVPLHLAMKRRPISVPKSCNTSANLKKKNFMV